MPQVLAGLTGLLAHCDPAGQAGPWRGGGRRNPARSRRGVACQDPWGREDHVRSIDCRTCLDLRTSAGLAFVLPPAHCRGVAWRGVAGPRLGADLLTSAGGGGGGGGRHGQGTVGCHIRNLSRARRRRGAGSSRAGGVP